MRPAFAAVRPSPMRCHPPWPTSSWVRRSWSSSVGAARSASSSTRCLSRRCRPSHCWRGCVPTVHCWGPCGGAWLTTWRATTWRRQAWSCERCCHRAHSNASNCSPCRSRPRPWRMSSPSRCGPAAPTGLRVDQSAPVIESGHVAARIARARSRWHLAPGVACRAVERQAPPTALGSHHARPAVMLLR